MKPHKHAEIIKQWADGVEVEYRLNDGAKGWSEWKTLAHDKLFLSDSWWEYRIKPQNLSAAYIVDHKYSVRAPEHWEKPNLTLTFDGETGKLKSAEVI